MHLRTLILYPEETRGVAAETVRRVEEAPANEGCVRPAILPDGTLARTLVRGVEGVLRLRDDSPLGGPRLHHVVEDPIRWVAHAVEAAVELQGHVLLRREGWTPDELAAAGLGLLRRDPEGGWTDQGRADIRRWLFDPRRPEADVLDMLRHAASSGVWCVYADDDL